MKGIGGAALKWIAIVSMTIDHFVAAFETDICSMPNGEITYFVLRSIGRIAFPVFAFLLVQGFLHTKDAYRYLYRLLLFAIISEIPADYAFYGHMTSEWCNVYFTLTLGLLMLIGIYQFQYKPPVSFWIISLCFLVFFSFLAELFQCDYGMQGIFLIYVLYMFRTDKLLWAMGTFACFSIQPARMMSYPLLLLYNGERGRQPKYLFYLYYPLHLTLLFLVRQWC